MRHEIAPSYLSLRWDPLLAGEEGGEGGDDDGPHGKDREDF